MGKIRDELAGYSLKEKKFIFFAMLCGFFICSEYAIVRPVSNSLFLSAFSADFLPYVWLAILPLNFGMVSLYNRLITKWGSKKLFLSLMLTVAVINFFFASYCKAFPSLSFLFYMWKEVYILLMFQMLWSLIHSTVRFNQAKYLYGIFFGVGGLGSMFGSSFPSFFAMSYGSENLLYLSLPIYLVLFLIYIQLAKNSSSTKPSEVKSKKGGFKYGIDLIKNSKILTFTLLIVVFMQVASTIIDFQFNQFLEKAFVLKDMRTQYFGRMLSIVYMLTVVFQFFGTFLLVKFLGFKKLHFLVPGLLALFSIFAIAMPIFPILSLSFISIKAFDFSIFGVIKEMLYLPLSSDEKFRAKSVIDVFAYRSSKALASVLILLLPSFGALSWFVLTLMILWIISVVTGLKDYEPAKVADSSGLDRAANP